MKVKTKKKRKLCTFTINLDSRNVRTEYLHGEEYLVVPVVLMTEGVHDGSQGPLLYTKEDLDNWSVAWNHKPIVVYHPEKGPACTPQYLNKSDIGILLNVRWSKGKQRAEAWLNKKRTAQKEPRILKALDKGHVMEVSTGLYVEPEGPGGMFNGERYKAIARNHKPEHLAILPDQEGACSIKKGAGLYQLNSYNPDEPRDNKGRWTDGLHAKSLKQLQSDPRLFNPSTKKWSRRGSKELKRFFKSQLRKAKKKRENKKPKTKITLEERKKLYDVLTSNGPDVDMHSSSFGRLVGQAKKAKVLNNPNKLYNWLKKKGMFGKASDTLRASGDKYFWNSASSKGKQLFVSHRSTKMKRKVFVDRLIKNKLTKFTDKDRKWLLSLNNAQLKTLQPEAPAFSFATQEELDAAVDEGIESGLVANLKKNPKLRKKVENALKIKTKVNNNADPDDDEDDDGEDAEAIARRMAKNKKKKQQQVNNSDDDEDADPDDIDAYLAKAPAPIRQVMNAALETAREEHERLVETIVANKSNTFEEDELKAMSMKQLRGIAALCENTGDVKNKKKKSKSYFGGQAVADQSVLNALFGGDDDGEKEEGLDLPVYNFGKNNRYADDRKPAKQKVAAGHLEDMEDDDDEEIDD